MIHEEKCGDGEEEEQQQPRTLRRRGVERRGEKRRVRIRKIQTYSTYRKRSGLKPV
jgi:hypothetical protein